MKNVIVYLTNIVFIMQRYSNTGGSSGVHSYEIGENYVDVVFSSTRKTYRYSYSSAGRGNVETMKRLARSGSGLNAFINTNVKNLYER